MKKFLAILLVFLLVLSTFVACNSGNGGETESPPTSKPKRILKRIPKKTLKSKPKIPEITPVTTIPVITMTIPVMRIPAIIPVIPSPRLTVSV